jgi:hypothetical protein
MPSPGNSNAARNKFGFTYFGGIGDCLRILVLYHGRLLHWINRGETPIRWNEGGSASNQLVNDYIISRIPGFRAAAEGEPFTDLLTYPRWQRFFRWTRTPIPFQLTPPEEAALPRLPGDKPNIAICPHHNGLACKKLPVSSINKLLDILRAELDANYHVFDERIDPGAVDAPCIGGLNLTQAMVLMARFDAAISVDSWQKYIMGMHGKPQTVLVVDFRKNESYTHEGTPAGIYQEFFRWRMRPGEIVGYDSGFAAFKWMTAAEVPPEVLAEHFLTQVASDGKFWHHFIRRGGLGRRSRSAGG